MGGGEGTIGGGRESERMQASELGRGGGFECAS